MKITQSTIFFIIVIVIVLGAIMTFMSRKDADQTVAVPGKYDSFATCLKDKGAVFYGAFWCPHCNNEKALFGSSKDLVPYVECSTPDGKGQTQICADEKVESYPTWMFSNPIKITEQTAPIVCTCLLYTSPSPRDS